MWAACTPYRTAGWLTVMVGTEFGETLVDAK